MSADRLRDAARVLRARAMGCDPWHGDDDYASWVEQYQPSWSGDTDSHLIQVMHPGVALALADWLDAATVGDGRMPHRYPEAAPAEVISWECAACGATVREMAPHSPCSVDWRPRDPRAEAVADAILGGRP